MEERNCFWKRDSSIKEYETMMLPKGPCAYAECKSITFEMAAATRSFKGWICRFCDLHLFVAKTSDGGVIVEWRGSDRGLTLEWQWSDSGVKMEWQRSDSWVTAEWRWSETGVTMEWNWSDSGVTMEWQWSDSGVTAEWRWSGTGVTMEWNWSDSGVTMEWQRSENGVTAEWQRSDNGVTAEWRWSDRNFDFQINVWYSNCVDDAHKVTIWVGHQLHIAVVAVAYLSNQHHQQVLLSRFCRIKTHLTSKTVTIANQKLPFLGL